MERPLVVFIVGTTAVGKTKLSIQLCKLLGGEVINCDSKQLYKHASIMTAKASIQQRQGIPHHMLDALQLQENCYNRNKYFKEAIKCIEDIVGRGKVPVVIGGTSYYMETLLYNIKMDEGELEHNQQKQNNQTKQKVEQQCKDKLFSQQQINKMTKNQKYAHLQKIDPLMAQKLHCNDENRITSFLQRYSQTGIPPSSNYKPYVHDLRFSQTVLFWIRNSDKKQLHELMTKRIDKMVVQGGLNQTLSIFQYAKQKQLLEGLKMGALQSIGYKEFEEVYHQVEDLVKLEGNNNSIQQISKTFESQNKQIREKITKIKVKSIRNNGKVSLLQKCKEVLTKNTIDYSKRQVTWIRNRLFGNKQNINNFFVLQLEQQKNEAKKDLMSRFDLQVKSRAMQIIQTVKQKGFGSIKQNQYQFGKNKHESIEQWKKYKCDQCKTQVNGSHQWKQHLNSRKHREILSKKERIQKKRQQKAQQKAEQNLIKQLSKKDQ